MKPVDVKPSIYIITLIKKIIKKALNLKLVCYYKIVITKVKNIVSQTYVISDLKGEDIVGTFYEKEF